MITTPRRSRIASSTARVIFSPTTDPIEPAKNWKSMTASIAGLPPMSTLPVMTASLRPVFSRRAEIFPSYLVEAERVGGEQTGVGFLEGAGIGEQDHAFAAAHEEMVVALLANLKVLLEFQSVNHRLALGALGPESLRSVVAFAGIAEAWFVENAHGCNRLGEICRVRMDRVRSMLAAHHGDDNHLLKSGLAEDAGAFVDGGAGGEDIIDQDGGRSPCQHFSPSGKSESAVEVFLAFLAG